MAATRSGASASERRDEEARHDSTSHHRFEHGGVRWGVVVRGGAWWCAVMRGGSWWYVVVRGVGAWTLHLLGCFTWMFYGW